MKKTVAIIVLCNIILVLLIIIIGIIFFSKQKLKKQVEEFLYNYELAESEYLQKIKDRDNWRKNFQPQTDKEKELLRIIDEDTKLLKECQKTKQKLKKELETTLSQINRKKNELQLFVLTGLSANTIIDIEPDVYIGLLYNRTLIQTKKVDFFVGGGGAVKVYQNRGGALTIQTGLRF